MILQICYFSEIYITVLQIIKIQLQDNNCNIISFQIVSLSRFEFQRNSL